MNWKHYKQTPKPVFLFLVVSENLYKIKDYKL